MKTKDEQQMNDDLFLWHGFISGDEQSFNRLYDKYVRILYAYGLHYTADRDLLKDCIQDTFLKIYHDRTGLECINNIKSYLCVLLKNNLINAARREDIHLRYIQSLDPSHEDDDDTAETRIINEECRLIAQRKIEKIMSQLSDRQKEVICLRFFEGKSIDEIAKLMNMNYQSVQNIIQRAIRKAANFFLKKK
jgi:RNA polymerase sigma factor (sigma-70 family)